MVKIERDWVNVAYYISIIFFENSPNVCVDRREDIGDWKFQPQSSEYEETYSFTDTWSAQRIRKWIFPSHSPEKRKTLGLCKPIGRYTLPLLSYNCIEKNDRRICTLT